MSAFIIFAFALHTISAVHTAKRVQRDFSIIQDQKTSRMEEEEEEEEEEEDGRRRRTRIRKRKKENIESLSVVCGTWRLLNL